MAYTRCEKGHFYDSDKYQTCPFCNQASDNKVIATAPLSDFVPTNSLNKNVPIKQPDDVGKTISAWSNYEVSPVVGWLVSIEGTTQGEDFRLCSGRNYIGRDNDMDVVLHNDNTVSRQKHAIVIFDPISQTTLCQAGESRELFYVNGKVVTDTVEIHKGDVLTIGKTKLMFVPFCGELHNWEEK